MNEVYNRVPRKGKRKDATNDARKQLEKDTKELHKQRYSFVMDEDDSSVSQKEKGKSKAKEPSKKERHTRKRETDGREWESDEEEASRKRLRSEDHNTPTREDDDEAEFEPIVGPASCIPNLSFRVLIFSSLGIVLHHPRCLFVIARSAEVRAL